jgi:penicillin-binding protein 2
MFHQRLVLLGVLIALGMVAPVAQLWRWTVVHGETKRREAESYLTTWKWLPTTRGQLLDRKGRVLATDRPSFDIAVDYRVINGQWAYTQAYKRARRLHADEWAKMTSKGRRELAERYEPDFRARLDEMWEEFARLGGITRPELEERKGAVVKRVQELAARVRANQLAKLQKQAEEAGVEVKVKPEELNRPVAEEQQGHVLLKRVSDLVAYEFLRRTADTDAEDAAAGTVRTMPGVTVLDTGSREYPFQTLEVTLDRSAFPSPLRSEQTAVVKVNGVATHVIGWMRHRVYAEDNWDDLALPKPMILPDGSPDRSLYLEGESIGQTGMERGAERVLRGLRGIERTRLDTGEVEETPAKAGMDVALTLDIQLQARVQALFDNSLGMTVVQAWHTSRQAPDEELPRGVPRLGEPLAGSAVVIDIASGDILAMATSPTFTPEMASEQPDVVFRDELMMASLNRAISQPYAPGSIVKPLVLCAAVTEGKYDGSERIACTGHFYPNQPNALQCWTQKQFGTNHSIKLQRDLDGRDAIMGSCNIFFYEMGSRLGPARITEWFRRFGVGGDATRWNLGLGNEYPGSVPAGATMTKEAAILLGIGQGPIAWTPLHAADAYATLARAGVRIVPRLRLDQAPVVQDLKLDPRGVEQALAGLAAAARDENGTAHHITVPDPATGALKRELIFNALEIPGISVWAKSGTADASALVSHEGGQREVIRDGDHAWCVYLVGDEGLEGRPKFAVAVVVDYGGSGGRVAGPIANQVIYALMGEGYLKPRGKAKEPAEGPRATR